MRRKSKAERLSEELLAFTENIEEKIKQAVEEANKEKCTTTTTEKQNN
ncbi:MAG: hypothetical protein Q4E61_01290 [Alphaproteobacteria bacterium]|nr:hypothetical protein [Alphaproteobacteria bacterium]